MVNEKGIDRMSRYVIRNTKTLQYLKGTGKHKEWVTFLQEADLYKKKLTGLWWDEDTMELVPVTIKVLIEKNKGQKYLIRNTHTGQYLKGTHWKDKWWVDSIEEADLYKKKPDRGVGRCSKCELIPVTTPKD